MERGGWGLPPTRAAGRESPSTPSNPHPGSLALEPRPLALLGQPLDLLGQPLDLLDLDP